jgi:ribonuclease M5
VSVVIKIKEAVIVEGKYDKIKLSNILDTVIIETDGFAIFKDKEKQGLIRFLSEKRGIIIMTDSDSAGFKIRNFINGITKSENIKNVFIPDIYGKEKRKVEASKEGKLGVEGMSAEVILNALEKAGVLCTENTEKQGREITHTDFFEDGISGGSNSSVIRKAFAKELDLPERISSSSLLKVINSYMTFDEYKETVKKIQKNI